MGPPVSDDCICLPSSVSLTFETMPVCLHTSHTDAFHVPVSEVERMAVGSFSASCPVALFRLLMTFLHRSQVPCSHPFFFGLGPVIAEGRGHSRIAWGLPPLLRRRQAPGSSLVCGRRCSKSCRVQAAPPLSWSRRCGAIAHTPRGSAGDC